MKKVKLVTVMSISAFSIFLFLFIFLETESKPLKSQSWQMEKVLSSSPEIAAKKYKASVQSCNPIQMSGQIKIMSCCSGASRYQQLKKYQTPLQKNSDIDSLKMNKTRLNNQ